MKLQAMASPTMHQLVEEFIRISKERGAAILDSNTINAKRTFEEMRAVDRILRSRGRDSRLALLPLLEDKDRFVRYFAAKYLLGLVPDRARHVIEEIAKLKYDALSGDAGMCLYALDKGIFKPD
jgi:hypothetical protein